MPAEPAYDYYPYRAYQAAPARKPQQEPRPRISVVPGRGPQQQPRILPVNVVFLAKVVAVVLVVVSIIAFVRIGLTSATVATSMDSQTLSEQISEARASGESMEVSQSFMSNPTYLKMQAAALGMSAPETIDTIDLGVDIVACDGAGNLSFSKSVDLAVSSGA